MHMEVHIRISVALHWTGFLLLVHVILALVVSLDTEATISFSYY